MLRLAFAVNAMLNLSILSKSRLKHVLKHVAQAKFMHRLVSPAALISDWAALRRGRGGRGYKFTSGTESLLGGWIVGSSLVSIRQTDIFLSVALTRHFTFLTRNFSVPWNFVAAANRLVCTGGLWKSLPLQQVAQLQSDMIFCDLLQRQNSVAETTIFRKNYPVHTKRFVAATCRLTVLLQLVARPVHMEWSVAATSCCNVCNLSPSVYRPLRTRKCSRPSGTPG